MCPRDRRMDRRTDGQTDGQTDGRMDCGWLAGGRMSGRLDGGWKMDEWVCDTGSIPEVQKGQGTRKSPQSFELPEGDWDKEVKGKTLGGTRQAPVAPGLPQSPWTRTPLSLAGALPVLSPAELACSFRLPADTRPDPHKRVWAPDVSPN